jgi:chitin disaccharide deacetylase
MFNFTVMNIVFCIKIFSHMKITGVIAVAVLLISALLVFPRSGEKAQPEQKIRLLVRADDMGSSHAANRACIDTYTGGIVRSVEVMVNCAWFPEAVEMLRRYPEYDAGVHLMLTSEWDLVKWRPLTHAPSLVDSNGYFFPMIWANDNYPPHRTLKGANWNISEIEQELRAQIELAIKHIPQISHISTHMGFSGMDPAVEELVKRLAREYNIFVDLSAHHFKPLPGWKNNQTLEEKTETFARNLSNLSPGNYIFVEHPAYDEPEMRSTFHTGYTTVAKERDEVTKIFTSPRVQQVIKQKGIELVSYGQFR